MRDRRIRYQISFRLDRGGWTPMAWDHKHAGRPNAANLARHCQLLEDPTWQASIGLEPTQILFARLTDTESGSTVAEYRRNN